MMQPFKTCAIRAGEVLTLFETQKELCENLGLAAVSDLARFDIFRIL